MRDPDEVMAHEARQQKLVEDIVRSLHDEADKIEDNDYLVVFRPLAKDLFGELCGDRLNAAYPSPTVKMVIEFVNRPIINFIGRDKLKPRFAEFQYLKLKVFEKVSAAIASRIISEYHQLELGF